MAEREDPDAVGVVSVNSSGRVSRESTDDPRHILDTDVDSPLASNIVTINNRWVVPTVPNEFGLEIVDDGVLRLELCPWETMEPGYRDRESVEPTDEDLDRDTFPAYPKTWQLRVQRAVALEMIVSARREVVQLGLPGDEVDKLLEDLDAREMAMRRPQHRDILEAASEIKGIDSDSTAAEHEIARRRWKENVNELKAASAARTSANEEDKRTTTHILGTRNATIASPILWSAGAVAIVVVLASIFVAWWATTGKASTLSQR